MELQAEVDIATMLCEMGACQDCGCPVQTLEVAMGHAQGTACEDWNSGEGKGMLTWLNEDGTYELIPINSAAAMTSS